MRGSGVAVGVVVAAGLVTGEARAQDSYAAPVFGASGTVGPRSGWGGPDEAIFGGGIFGGVRLTQWRLGVRTDFFAWREAPGVALDAGVFASADFVSVWLDPQLSAAGFVRIEPKFRWVSSTSQTAAVPSLGAGIRLLGFELGLDGMLEVGLQAPAANASRFGVDVLARLGIDLVEIGWLCRHVSESNQPLAP